MTGAWAFRRGVDIITDCLTRRAMLMAAVRSGAGGAMLATALLLPPWPAAAAHMLGNAFLLLALIGLLGPLEARVTGGIADRVIGLKDVAQ